MKKIYFAILILGIVAFWFWGPKGKAGSFGGADEVVNVAEVISPDEIYVFIQKGCPHCWAAEAYLKEKHPDLKMRMEDIAKTSSRNLFYACGAKFKLNKYSLGTPLFCMGDKYILGWDQEAQEQFEEYLKEFLSKE